MEILKSAHSGWRYIVLILLVIAFVQALLGVLGKKEYTEGNRKLNLFTLISAHIQLLMGLILYFGNGWYKADSALPAARYWKMEHIGMMVLAVVLITIGNSRSKKASTALAKHKGVALYFGLALLLIIAAILAMLKVYPDKSFFGMS